jgi:hypothetical protein
MLDTRSLAVKAVPETDQRSCLPLLLCFSQFLLDSPLDPASVSISHSHTVPNPSNPSILSDQHLLLGLLPLAALVPASCRVKKDSNLKMQISKHLLYYKYLLNLILSSLPCFLASTFNLFLSSLLFSLLSSSRAYRRAFPFPLLLELAHPLVANLAQVLCFLSSCSSPLLPSLLGVLRLHSLRLFWPLFGPAAKMVLARTRPWLTSIAEMSMVSHWINCRKSVFLLQHRG